VSRPPRVRGFPGIRSFVCIALLGAFFAAAAPTASAGVMKRLDFETGSLVQWTSKQAMPGRIDIIPSPVRQGQFASRFTVKPGDRPVPGGERAEVYWRSREHAGVTSWWRWSTYFPTGFHPNRGGWNIFTQWHHTGSSCTSPVRFQVQHEGDRSWLRLEVWGGRLNTGTCEPQYKRAWNLGKFRRNRWYNFSVKVHWSPRRGHGLLVVRVNNHKKVDSHTANLYKGQGVYVKQGFYRGESNKRTTIIHDGMTRFRP
jgi:polysaccharide lyase-like protein